MSATGRAERHPDERRNVLKSRSALVITVGSDTVASSRVRGAALVSELVNRGWSVDRVSASDRLWPLRALGLVVRNPLDLIVLQKVTPPSLMTSFLRSRSRRLVLEIDDAIYLGYPGATLRQADAARRRVEKVSRMVGAVVTSNTLIAEDIAQLRGPQANSAVVVFPGPAPALRQVDHARKVYKRVLWLGSPSTYPGFIEAFADIEQRLSENGFSLHVVGSPHASTNATLREEQWSLAVEEQALREATIGVMPLPSGLWTARKAAYKVLEYLAADIIPVAASSAAIDTLLGDERDLLGIFPSSDAIDWLAALEAASRLPVGDEWRMHRDGVFDRLSSTRFASLFVGQEHRLV